MTKLKAVHPRDDRPLDNRIAAAFTDSAISDTVAALIQEAEVAHAAGVAAGQARAGALDPATADAATAGARWRTPSGRPERLQAAVSRLRERLTEVQAAEEDDRRRAALRGGQG